MDWSTCSPDVILLIFKFLDHKSLANCLSVCKLWRSVVDHIGKINGIWPYLAPNAMYNRGIAFKQKSILPWRDLYFNSVLWKNGNVHLQLDKILEMVLLKDIHIYQDNIFVILDYGMKHYKVDTLIQTLEETHVIDYQQSRYITAKLRTGMCLSVKIGKEHEEFTTSVHKFKVIENYCFVIDQRKVLILYKCHKNIPEYISTDIKVKTALMKFYTNHGWICSVNMYDDEVYVLKQYGNLLYLHVLNFNGRPIGEINLPHCYNSPLVFMFLKHSVVYSVRSENGTKHMKVTEIGNTGEIVVESSGLTCATSHGDLLFLGYEDGEVSVYLPKKMLRSKEPHITFNIKDIADCTIKDPTVKAIEVYEAIESHYLFIATRFELIKVIVTHNN